MKVPSAISYLGRRSRSADGRGRWPGPIPPEESVPCHIHFSASSFAFFYYSPMRCVAFFVSLSLSLSSADFNIFFVLGLLLSSRPDVFNLPSFLIGRPPAFKQSKLGFVFLVFTSDVTRRRFGVRMIVFFILVSEQRIIRRQSIRLYGFNAFYRS